MKKLKWFGKFWKAIKQTVGVIVIRPLRYTISFSILLLGFAVHVLQVCETYTRSSKDFSRRTRKHQRWNQTELSPFGIKKKMEIKETLEVCETPEGTRIVNNLN